MLIDNATLRDVSLNPILYLPSRELIENRTHTDPAKLDIDVWRELYDRALNAESVVTKIAFYFKNDTILDRHEWYEVAHVLKDHNLLLNGGASAVMSLLFSIEYYASGKTAGTFDQQLFGEEVKKYRFDEEVVAGMREIFDSVVNPDGYQNYVSAFIYAAAQILPTKKPSPIKTSESVTYLATTVVSAQGCTHGGEHDELLEEVRQKITIGHNALFEIEKVTAPYAGAPTVVGSVDPLIFEPFFVSQLEGFKSQYRLIDSIADRSEAEEKVLEQLLEIMALMRAYLNKYIS